MTYVIPDPLPWTALASPLAAAEDSLARLDERLGSSLIREGWISRTHLLDACASLGLQGALVHLEDLVLHDTAMDLRAPTHEITRAHAVLRTRRSIARAEPSWATSPAGLADLSRGRKERGGGASGAGIAVIHEPTEEKAGEGACDDDAFAAELAAIDTVLERSSRALAGAVPPRAQDPLALVDDLDWDEGARRPRPTPPEAAVSVVIIILLRIMSALKDVSANRGANHTGAAAKPRGRSLGSS